jgi:hypothetical protein
MFNKSHSIQLQEAEPDNVYFNIDLLNDGTPDNAPPVGSPYTSEFKPATFDQTRGNAIINRARDYYLSVIRFKVPLYTVPVMIWPVELGQDNPLVSSMKIGMTYENSGVIPPVPRQTVIFNVVLQPRTYFPAPPNTGPFTEQPNTQYTWVYDYGNVTDSVTVTLKAIQDQLLDQINAINTSVIPAELEGPFFEYDADSEKFYFDLLSLYYQISVDDPSPIPVIQIFWNTEFQRFFTGFKTEVDIDKLITTDFNARILRVIKNNYLANPIATDSQLVPQQWISTQTWDPMRNLFFESNLSALKGELTTEDSSFKKIMIDAVPSEFALPPRTDYIYFPNNNLRLIDIIDNSDIKKIQFAVKWIDIYGYEHLIYIPPFSYLNIKLLFQKKSLIKTYQRKYE